MATVSHWQAAGNEPVGSSEPAERYDVAVVGGGIAGVSVAYWLKRLEPALTVVLLERERLARGASGRNAGFLLQGTDADYASAVERHGRERARRLWQLTQETRDGLVRALAGVEIGLEQNGSFTVAGDADEDERLRRSAELLHEDGVAAEYVGSDATAERVGCRGLGGALFVPSGAALDPARAVRALARRSGADVLEQWPVGRVEAARGSVRLVGPRGVVEAERVVIALNAYLPRLVPELADVVRPVRAQMGATAPQPIRLRHPIYTHAGYFYLRQLPTGEVLVGGARHLHRDEEIGYADTTTEPLQADLEAYLRRHFPDLAAPAVRQWSGTMGFGADGLPGFGLVPERPGAWWVGGFTGHGMGYAFRAGRTVAAAVLGQGDRYISMLQKYLPA